MLETKKSRAIKKFSKAESKDNREYKPRTRNPTKHFTVEINLSQ